MTFADWDLLAWGSLLASNLAWIAASMLSKCKCKVHKLLLRSILALGVVAAGASLLALYHLYLLSR